jgi:aldehyde:ferredoxin oxidoreductase
VLSRLLELTTGMELNPAEIRRIGERIWNLHRMFNVREDVTRADDMPPYPWMHQDLPRGDGGAFPAIPPDRIQSLLDEYYQERGWDLSTGNPTNEKLAELVLK